tara:strand:- start:617 stop:2812 length:2196 start_codon:yes stop_codon:yes gene_type:complete
MTIKKAKGVTSGKGTPHKLEGNNGDMSVRHTRRGKKLYVKDMNNWHNINLDIDNVEIQKNVDELLKEVRRMKNRTRNNPVLDSVFFKKRGADSVKLKNESGILKVRTQADDGDAAIQCDAIKNSTGVDTIKIKAVSSVVNALGVYGGASGNGPILTPNTAATDLDLIINPKGAGDIVINPATTKGLKITGSASTSTNYLYSTVASDGASTIKTLNNDANPTAHLTLDVHGDIELNADGGDVVFKDASADIATFSTGGGSIITHTSTATSIGFKVDSNLSGNDASSVHGLGVDFDRTVAQSGTAAHNDIGIKVDINSASLGTSSVKGMDIDVYGATSGTNTAVGIDLNVSGSDIHQGLNITVPDDANDYHMRLIAADDTNDYATFSVANTGDLTIATTGDGTTDSDITLHADGNIILTAESGFVGVSVSDPDEAFEVSGNIKFTSDGQQLRAADGNSLLREASNILYLGNGGTTTTYIYGNTGLGVTDPDTKLEIMATSTQLKLSYDATNYSTLTVAANGAVTIATQDADAATAHLTLAPDGDIILNSKTGNFSALINGNEFSAANSAYAGMILGYTTIGIDSADDSYAVSNSMVVVSDSHKVKFVAPPSGVVEIQVFIQADAGAGRPLRFGLSDASATTGYSPIDFPNSNDTTNEHEVLQVDETDEVSVNHHWVVTGLTAGTAYEWWLAASCSHNSIYVLRWGGNVTAEYAPFIMKVTALPTAVTDYAVYG